VSAGHSLMYARAESLDATAPLGIFHGALRWSHQYESLPVFVSSGPRILEWPRCRRVATYGAEGFAPGASSFAAPLAISAPKGLTEVKIFDGRRLFRRFELHGASSFETTLVLDGAIQRNLVVVASDRAGGSAVSAP